MTWSRHRFHALGQCDLGLKKSSHTASGLITEGIFDSNIDDAAPDNIRVTLWREWPAMLADLPAVGPVWSIVRNPHCVLAVHGDYPRLALSSNRQSALARHGETSHLWSLSLNLNRRFILSAPTC